MITIGKKRAAGLGAMLIMAAASGWAVRSAWADGIPEADVLTYAGLLEDNAGAPLSGSKNIQVNVYPDATNGAPVCVAPKAIQNVVAGRFEVKMPASCVTAMKGNPNAHVEVVVDDKSLGKSRVGAVPFAIEAARAGEATGALKAQVEGKADGPSTTAALGGKADKSSVAVITGWSFGTCNLRHGGTSAVVAATQCSYRRVGDVMEVKATWHTPGGLGAAGGFFLELPDGKLGDVSKVPTHGATGRLGVVGSGFIETNKGALRAAFAHLLYSTPGRIEVVFHGEGGGTSFNLQSPMPNNGGEPINVALSLSVPIVGWTVTQ